MPVEAMDLESFSCQHVVAGNLGQCQEDDDKMWLGGVGGGPSRLKTKYRAGQNRQAHQWKGGLTGHL